jgi:hypothetical protein
MLAAILAKSEIDRPCQRTMMKNNLLSSPKIASQRTTNRQKSDDVDAGRTQAKIDKIATASHFFVISGAGAAVNQRTATIRQEHHHNNTKSNLKKSNATKSNNGSIWCSLFPKTWS